MSEKRFDGAQELANMSGLGKSEVLSLWEQVKANSRALTACPKHRFPIGDVKLGQKIRCMNCGGEMPLGGAGEYVRGYRAAGGNPDDVWPDFFKEKAP